MAKYVFPATFTKEKSGLYSVFFPDIESCFTQGCNIQDALFMAQDVLSMTLCDMEDEKNAIPIPTSPETIDASADTFVSLVCADTTEYRKTYNGKAVKKTLTIPQWLNEAATRENVNFSQVLKDALISKLNIQ